MAMIRLGRKVAASRVVNGDTVALVPAQPSGAVVLNLHGWPNGDTSATALGGLTRGQQTGAGYPIDALLAIGTTIVYPWTGASWGTPAGTTAITDQATAMLTALGITATRLDIVAGSMGALHAVNLAAVLTSANVVLYVPALDIGAMWDLGTAVPTIRTSLETAWSSSGRAATVAAAAAIDPVSIDCSHLTDRTLVLAANNDPLVAYATVVDWCEEWDLPLTTTATGHLSLDDQAVDEIALLAHLTST
jgi:hypothetical protein